jgi:hypothetical protein
MRTDFQLIRAIIDGKLARHQPDPVAEPEDPEPDPEQLDLFN